MHAAGTANNDFGHLSDVFRTRCELQGHDLDYPFARLRLKEQVKTENHQCSTTWIRTRLLADGALNAEAQAPYLIMINTWARPSEIIDAAIEDFVLDAAIPHLCIRARTGRTVKTESLAARLALGRRLTGRCARPCWDGRLSKVPDEGQCVVRRGDQVSH